MSDRYVVVDTPKRLIIGGPYLWDGTAAWTPPEEGALILEDDAIASGYAAHEPDSEG
jgi:hypothetical protein